jgi:hypothetical protein
MVRHSASDAQKFVDFGSRRPGGFQFDRFEGTSGRKEFNGIGHGLIPIGVIERHRLAVDYAARSSWLSLATRSCGSAALLILYWKSSPSGGKSSVIL